jgi:glyoxylase-like metal-dependent hydrolase (beta-lactamase superfamily II)
VAIRIGGYLMATTMWTGPVKCSTRVWEKPTVRIHPVQSAPVKSKPPWVSISMLRLMRSPETFVARSSAILLPWRCFRHGRTGAGASYTGRTEFSGIIAAMTEPVPFNLELDFAYAEAAELSPLVRRVIADNPSYFTFHGTGSYIVGRGKVAIIDAGPDDPAHVEALLAAVAGEQVTHLLVTHTHRDHSPATAALKRATEAPSYGFGPHGTRRAGPAVEEGADYDFTPDHRLRDGDVIEGEGWTLGAVHTPGHTWNHLCFALAEERALFCGDHVMGWSSTVISPPDGDMATYVASLNKLLGRDEVIYYPTHGAPIDQPAPFVRALIEHRAERERQIAQSLADGAETIAEMVALIYTDVPDALHGAAARSVLAHLIHMVETGRAECAGPLEEGGRFSAVVTR